MQSGIRREAKEEIIRYTLKSYWQWAQRIARGMDRKLLDKSLHLVQPIRNSEHFRYTFPIFLCFYWKIILSNRKNINIYINLVLFMYVCLFAFI